MRENSYGFYDKNNINGGMHTVEHHGYGDSVVHVEKAFQQD